MLSYDVLFQESICASSEPLKPNQVINSKGPKKRVDKGTDMHSLFQQLEPEEDVTLSIEIHSEQVDRL